MDADYHPDGASPAARPAERIAAVGWLDAPAQRLAELADRPRGTVAELARGAPLGHPLHPALTDLPIGFWTSAFLLDVVGGRSAEPAARMLVGAGVLTAAPTIAAGLADLPRLDRRHRRVAVVHAGVNSAATSFYLASWWARRRRRRGRGAVLALAGAALATVGGYLGGWLAFGSENPRDRSTARSHVA